MRPDPRAGRSIWAIRDAKNDEASATGTKSVELKRMGKIEKTLDRVLRGTSDANIHFNDLRNLLKHLGFEERIRGSYHIFTREDLPEILNLQPRDSQAKPYQVKQVRGVLLNFRVVIEDPEEAPPAAAQEGRPQLLPEGPPAGPSNVETRPDRGENPSD